MTATGSFAIVTSVDLAAETYKYIFDDTEGEEEKSFDGVYEPHRDKVTAGARIFIDPAHQGDGLVFVQG